MNSGAYSVGAHLVTNDGDNEGLFRAGMPLTHPSYIPSRLLTNILLAIMESGNAVGPPYNGTDWYQPMYDQIVNATKYASIP